MYATKRHIVHQPNPGHQTPGKIVSLMQSAYMQPNKLCARTAKVKIVPKVNMWPGFLSGQQILNVDASFSKGDYAGSCGAVLRDLGGVL